MTGDYNPQPSRHFNTDGDTGGGVSGCSKFLLRVAIVSIVIGVALGIVMHHA